MKTVIVGRHSNLSSGLSSAMPQSLLLSARDLATDDITSVLPQEPFVVVMNHFQPAARLNDVSDPVGYVDISLALTARLLQAVLTGNCRKILYTSSAAVYGDNVACREDDAPQAANLHSALKAANEHLIRSACGDTDVDYTIVRLFNLYGGRDNFSIAARIVAAVRNRQRLTLVNDGNAIRDFVHLDDVIQCYQRLIDIRGVPVVNVATGQGTSIRSIVDAVRLRGHWLDTTSISRQEIRISTADVSRLSAFVRVEHFVKVIDYVLSELR